MADKVTKAAPARALPNKHEAAQGGIKLADLANVPIIITKIGPVREQGGQFDGPTRTFQFQTVRQWESGSRDVHNVVTGSRVLIEQLNDVNVPAFTVVVAKPSPNPRFGDYYTLGNPDEYRENDDTDFSEEVPF